MSTLTSSFSYNGSRLRVRARSTTSKLTRLPSGARWPSTSSHRRNIARGCANRHPHVEPVQTRIRRRGHRTTMPAAPKWRGEAHRHWRRLRATAPMPDIGLASANLLSIGPKPARSGVTLAISSAELFTSVRQVSLDNSAGRSGGNTCSSEPGFSLAWSGFGREARSAFRLSSHRQKPALVHAGNPPAPPGSEDPKGHRPGRQGSRVRSNAAGSHELPHGSKG